MSVLGIMLLITLLLALDIADPSAAPAVVTSGDPQAVTAQEVAALEKQAQELRTRHETMLARLRELARFSGGDADLAALESSLALAEAQTAALAETAAEMKDALRLAMEDQRRAAELEADIQAVEAEVRAARSELADRQANPTLRYLPEAGTGKSAILVTVSADALGVGGTDPAATAVWFTADSASARQNQLRRFLKTIEPNAFYAVVLAKPDAFGGISEEVMRLIRTSGFDVGLDLLAQDEDVLLDAGAAR